MAERGELSAAELEELRSAALDLAVEARVISKRRFESALRRSYKSDGTIVTDADAEIEERLRSLIGRRFPDHGILGEEKGAERPEAPFQWILDPVDGTENFSRGIPTFGMIAALYLHGVPQVAIIDHPVLDLQYAARRGGGTFRNGVRIRTADLPEGSEPRREIFAISNPISYLLSGGCQPLLALLKTGVNVRIYGDCFAHTRAIEGHLGAMIAVNNKPWDIAASGLLMEEAGGAYRELAKVEDEGVVKTTAIFGKCRVIEYLMKFIAAQQSQS